MLLKVNRSIAVKCKSFLCLLLFLFLVTGLQADPVDSPKAERFVKGWLKQNRTPLDTHISGKIDTVDTYTDSDGGIQYYVVNLNPEGYIVLSADDLLEPVIAFSASGDFVASDENPLYVLVEKDTQSRNQYVKNQKQKQYAAAQRTKKQKKWDDISAKADQKFAVSYAISSITDVRVAPLIQSEWGQTHDGTGEYCYNYYTPSHYPSGCVATAIAQLMRYHEYPTTGVGGQSGTIWVNSNSQTASTRGGSGAGGAYNWSLMPDVPVGAGVSQRSEIGALCYDAGVSVGMFYEHDASGAFSSDVPSALMDYFNYSNAVLYQDIHSIPIPKLKSMINTNLDAALPVYLGITGDVGGHAILVDGYGYDNESLYHHLNMGWYGSDDAWYTLPDIDSDPPFDIVDDCIYNIYPSGSGEIASGRIIEEESGLPVSGVTVQAKQGASVISEDTTDSRGIYALQHLSSNQEYTLFASKTGYSFEENNIPVEIGLSSNDLKSVGNLSISDWTADNEEPPVASDMTVDISEADEILIALQAIDDGFPDPPAKLVYTIVSLPEHGWLFDSFDDSEITAVPYTLANDASSVIYKPCAYYFEGTDGFTFLANDGGVAPAGGDSNTASVTLNISTLNETLYEEDLTLKDYIPFMTGFKKVRTQTLYHADELSNEAQLVSNLALNIQQAPSIEIKNFTIRMKHTSLSEYSSSAQFDNTDWVVVYDANEIIDTTGWHDFELETMFAYDGVSNLLIDFSFDNTSTSTGYGYVYDSDEVSPAYRMISLWSNSGDPLEFVTPNVKWKRLLNIKLKSQPDVPILLSDFNYNCQVSSEDLMTMIDAWLTANGDPAYNPNCDISEIVDEKIDLSDFVVLASEWLETVK